MLLAVFGIGRLLVHDGNENVLGLILFKLRFGQVFTVAGRLFPVEIIVIAELILIGVPGCGDNFGLFISAGLAGVFFLTGLGMSCFGNNRTVVPDVRAFVLDLGRVVALGLVPMLGCALRPLDFPTVFVLVFAGRKPNHRRCRHSNSDDKTYQPFFVVHLISSLSL